MAARIGTLDTIQNPTEQGASEPSITQRHGAGHGHQKGRARTPEARQGKLSAGPAWVGGVALSCIWWAGHTRAFSWAPSGARSMGTSSWSQIRRHTDQKVLRIKKQDNSIFFKRFYSFILEEENKRACACGSRGQGRGGERILHKTHR